ncbi:hypothetical protein KSS87_016204 [Heliosperma pusillum]|nr:hypothetical protein KSS87_016204 [Heliosperma pusillum]
MRPNFPVPIRQLLPYLSLNLLTNMSLCCGLALWKPRMSSWCLQVCNNHVKFAKVVSVAATNASSHSISSLSGLDNTIKGYIFGENKATEVAHLLWKDVVKKGDIVVDATCGNGYDTLALAKLVIDTNNTNTGSVYALDLQQHAINATSRFLQSSLNPLEEGDGIGQKAGAAAVGWCGDSRGGGGLVAFNLGYLPGGDKKIITKSDTTLQALKAAKEILLPGGVISVIAYVGHPGGREEYEIVQDFASGLPPETWSCSQSKSAVVLKCLRMVRKYACKMWEEKYAKESLAKAATISSCLSSTNRSVIANGYPSQPGREGSCRMSSVKVDVAWSKDRESVMGYGFLFNLFTTTWNGSAMERITIF